MSDERHMARALELATEAVGSVSPRPPVGAIVVSSDGEIVGEGSTTPTPGPHAEIVALEEAGSRARGSTVYVTLEPCAHHGATPPCADALIEASVARCVAATIDPNPLTRGKGIERLREAGLDVTVGVREPEALRIVEPFAVWIASGRPFTTLKMAATLDGKVAAPDGTSKWVSGAAAREEVHELRGRVDAVMVGSGTVAADDPALTCRLPGFSGPQPRRVVCDSTGRTPPEAQILDGAAPAVVLTTERAPTERRGAWEATGAEVIVLPRAEEGVLLEAGLGGLGRLGICHVLVEGGPTLAAALVSRDLVDRFVLYLAPKLVGGDAPGILGWGVKTIGDARQLRIERVERVGDDLRVDARPVREGA